jgi:hypothetical protein
MATIDLGRIKFKWQGAYNGATAYVVDDVVESSGSAYVCILASTGNTPPNATYWELMSQKGVDADLINIASTAQGDIYYNNGGAIARLGAGTSGQFLKTQGTGANPQWGNVTSSILQVKHAFQPAATSYGSSGGMVSGVNISITPASASNRMLVYVSATGSSSGTTTGNIQMRFNIGSTVGTGDTPIGGGTASGSRPSAIGWMGLYYQNWNGTNIGYMFLHHPNTTSQCTYGLMMGGHDGGTYYLGRTERDTDDKDHGRFPTTMTILEIDSGVL